MELRVMELGLARASSRERSGGALPPTSRSAAAAWLVGGCQGATAKQGGAAQAVVVGAG